MQLIDRKIFNLLTKITYERDANLAPAISVVQLLLFYYLSFNRHRAHVYLDGIVTPSNLVHFFFNNKLI